MVGGTLDWSWKTAGHPSEEGRGEYDRGSRQETFLQHRHSSRLTDLKIIFMSSLAVFIYVFRRRLSQLNLMYVLKVGLFKVESERRMPLSIGSARAVMSQTTTSMSEIFCI